MPTHRYSREKARRKRTVVMVALMFFFLACGWLPNIYVPFYIPRAQATDVSFTILSTDTYVRNSDADYETARNATTASYNSTADIYVGQRYAAGNYYIYRSMFPFDTSSIPDDATITGVNWSGYVYHDYTETDFNLTIATGNGTRLHQPLYYSDYHYPFWFEDSTICGKFDTANVVEGQYLNISLSNFAPINVTGTSQILLVSEKDMNNQPCSTVAETESERVLFEDDADEYPAKLYVTYEMGNPTFEDVGNSGTLITSACKFSAKCTDPDGLSHWNFSYNFFWNKTSENFQWISEIYSFSGSPTTAWTNVTKRLPAEVVWEVQWFIKANDTKNIWGSTGTQAFNTTSLDYSTRYSLPVNSYTDINGWAEIGTTPYLTAVDYPSNYISAITADKQCQIGFADTNVATILGEEITLTITYSSSGRKCDVHYYIPTENQSDTGWRKVTTLNSTGGTGNWESYNFTLKGENEYSFNEECWWSWYYINELKINFTTDSTTGTIYIDYAKIIDFNGYSNNTRQVEWIFDNLVNRIVNDTFPMTYQYYEDEKILRDVTDNKLLFGIFLYELYNNETYLNYAEKYANWLNTQPVCRLFQTYNSTSNEWNNIVSSHYAGNRLFAMVEMAAQNQTYNDLAAKAVENFTDIFYHAQIGDASKNHFVNEADVNGTVTDDMIGTTSVCPSWSAVAYSGHVLGNTTIKNMAINASLSYKLVSIGLPACYQKLDGTYPGEDVKSDQHWGYVLLGLSSVYYYTDNADVKDKLKTVAEAGVYFWNETYADYGYFIYRVDQETGAQEEWTDAVHGFGYAEEGMIQAGLIWGNQTWIDWALNDFKSLVMHKFILENWLIMHAVSDQGMPENRESNDGWNSMAKRCALIWYCLNKTDFGYHNSTFVEMYSQLYASTSANHAFRCGWNSPIFTNTLQVGVYGDKSAEIQLSLLFRNILNETEDTINSLGELYNCFGNPFSGAGAKLVKPFPTNIGGNYSSTHATLYAYWTDLDGLVCGEKYWNVTGNWELNGTITFTGNPTEHWFNSTQPYPSGLSKIFWYQIVNDTEGNWGNTTIQILEVSQYIEIDLIFTFAASFLDSQQAEWDSVHQMNVDLNLNHQPQADFLVDTEVNPSLSFATRQEASWQLPLVFQPDLTFSSNVFRHTGLDLALDFGLEFVQIAKSSFAIDLGLNPSMIYTALQHALFSASMTFQPDLSFSLLSSIQNKVNLALDLGIGFSQLAQSIFNVDLSYAPSFTYEAGEKAIFSVPLIWQPNLGFTLDIDVEGAAKHIVDLALQIQVSFVQLTQSAFSANMIFQPSPSYDLVTRTVFNAPFTFNIDLGFLLQVRETGQAVQHYLVNLALDIGISLTETLQSIQQLALSVSFPFSFNVPFGETSPGSSGGPTMFLLSFIVTSFQQPLANCEIEIYELPYDTYKGSLYTDEAGHAEGSFPAGHYRYYAEVDGYVKEGSFFLDSAKQIDISLKKTDSTRILAAGILALVLMVIVVFAVLKKRGAYG